MASIDVYLRQIDFHRVRTLMTLDEIAKTADPAQVLAYRPGPGRAHIGWQMCHVAITEELFATERLFGRVAGFADLVPRFKGGSVPDDDVPSLTQIRELLAETRVHLKNALSSFTDQDLGVIPEPLKERGWNLERTLQVIGWHEAHHQGQSHITFNLWKAQAT
jgi:hypothetical protein